MPAKPNPIVEGAEKAAAALAGFDFNVDAQDFVLYELHRLIEEDRASFDESEFRTLIDSGVRAHISDRIEIRARLAGILRASATEASRTVILRIVGALEDLSANLCNVGVIVRAYTAYLLSRLEALAQADSGENDKIADAADLLFESTDDRDAAETALKILCGTRSPITARILAHAVSEPLLDEDLEMKAFAALKSYWPLPRHYLLYNLQGHPHEDIPFRWFQLFVEVDELTTVDLVLEEVRAHAGSPRYQEDLAALLEVLHGCRDPELEDKILGTINATSTTSDAASLLRKFIEDHQPAPSPKANPWSKAAQALELNLQYVEAASLFDQGQTEEARKKLEKILTIAPDYPFARCLTPGT